MLTARRLRIELAGRGKAEAGVVLVQEGGEIPPFCCLAAVADGFTGAVGQACLVLAGAVPTLLVGLGRAPDRAAVEAAGAVSVARLARFGRVRADLSGISVELAAGFALGAALRMPVGDFRTREDEEAPRIARLDVAVGDRAGWAVAWRRAEAVLEGVLLARRLVSLPGNFLNPVSFCNQIAKLEKLGLTLEVLTGKALRRAGLGGLMAVGQGSESPPALAVLRWKGTLDLKPVVFVGKGITFDTGGVSIKPAEGMWDMRADMAGSAACVGAMVALARRGSVAPAIAVLALAENAIGARSYRPGDVLWMHGGRSVEIIDTDAEGRLVLGDAISWAVERFAPRAVIDLATLTGAIVVALGHEYAGLFGNDAGLAAHVAAAGCSVGEGVWEMPIGDTHRDDLKSDIADLRQCVPGRGQPDACHAAAFLREFAGETKWAHLDIAGVEMWDDAEDAHPKGASGFGVRLLDALMALRFEDLEYP